MNFSQTAASGNSYSHLWDVSSTKAFDGGFLFDKATVPTGTTKLPKGAFLKLDQTERTAKMIKTAVLYEDITIGSTTVKVAKGALLVVADVLGIGAKAAVVGSIDTSNADYDSFSITANAFGAQTAGAVLQTFDAAGSSGKTAVDPDGVNPADVIIDDMPTCSALFRIDGVVTSRLPQAVTASIKTALKNVQFLNI